MTEATRLSVDLDLCQGHAVCQEEAPEVFSVPKHGQVEIADPAADSADVRRAVRYCPTQALAIGPADRTEGAR
ncbi:ferredoxin [Nocardia sp. NPDC048505]|uniref:ferredoxin n=1 Tax=Nocardia sp. NPDC048505 TaxID=3155756 RepID=UPI0033C5B435